MTSNGATYVADHLADSRTELLRNLAVWPCGESVVYSVSVVINIVRYLTNNK